MSQTRGAAAPTSGSQDHVSVDEVRARRRRHQRRATRPRSGRRPRQSNARRCSNESSPTRSRSPKSGTPRPAWPRATTRRVPKGARSSSRDRHVRAHGPTVPALDAGHLALRTTAIPGAGAPQAGRTHRRPGRAVVALRSDALRGHHGRGLDGARRHRSKTFNRRRRGPIGSPSEHVGVSLVLGAGNVGSLGPRDVLTKLFAGARSSSSRPTPSTTTSCRTGSARSRHSSTRAYLRIVSGGAQVGAYLVGHALVDDIHMTGSDKTHDAIVFGVGPEGARRKAANDAARDQADDRANSATSRRSSSCPGVDRAEIDYQARHVATMVANNAGFNCLTPARDRHARRLGPTRGVLHRARVACFASLPTRDAYYPGANERHAAFLAAHPDAQQVGDGERRRAAVDHRARCRRDQRRRDLSQRRSVLRAHE